MFGKANVGMSNDKPGEKPGRRKTKDSGIYGNQIRVSRDLRISREVRPMESGLKFLRRCILRCGDGTLEVSRADGIAR